MAIQFKLVPRKNPQDLSAAPKYYAQAVSDRVVNVKKLAERVAKHTTISAADLYGALIATEAEIISALKDGDQVDYGELCIFYPDIESVGVNSEAEFNATSHITKRGVRIRTKKSLSQQMATVPVEKIS